MDNLPQPLPESSPSALARAATLLLIPIAVILVLPLLLLFVVMLYLVAILQGARVLIWTRKGDATEYERQGPHFLDSETPIKDVTDEAKIKPNEN